jgi:GGDEF domain-containing protein/FixJ family two-component response regulator
MSIVNTYKSEFKIWGYDEDLKRGQKLYDRLKSSGYQFLNFSSRGLFLDAIEGDLPHIIILYYQPLNLKFREILTKLRKMSHEVEVIILGSNDFWPGVDSLLKAGLVNDFWSWPMADTKVLELRINQIIEKNIYKFVAEQREGESQHILKKIDEIKAKSLISKPEKLELTDVLDFVSDHHNSEPRMIEDLINQLKKTFPMSDFVYLKNYPVKNQLLITRTSFTTEDFFRGQSITFNQERLGADKLDVYNQVRSLLEETFDCQDFKIQPVELGADFFGFIMAIHFDSMDFLKRTSQYLAIQLKNCILESTSKRPDRDSLLSLEVKASEFPLKLSAEISRARRLKLPLALILTHLEYVQAETRDRAVALEIITNSLRSYDFISHIDNEKVMIVLPHCTYENAAIKAETMRRQLVALGLKTQNTPLRLCVGVSEYPSLSQDSDSLIVDVQNACAQVLASGKNKVCLYTKKDNFEPDFVAKEI